MRENEIIEFYVLKYSSPLLNWSFKLNLPLELQSSKNVGEMIDLMGTKLS
jgi:hypothetical protein